ncbi:MAG: Smr/MutS family protein, partial [Vicinamibacterales bacterium]
RGAARSAARLAVDAVAQRVLAPASPSPPEKGSGTPGPIRVGSRVQVGALGLEGMVTALHDGSAELDVRGKRMRAPLRDLKAVGGGAAAASGSVRVHVELQPRESAATELNVIGCTVDEALTRAERFLDESLLGDHRILRFVHGHGTGQLRRALGGFLRQHPLVATVTQAPPEQGGGGVTVAELKD